MKVLVIGASGKTGQKLLAELANTNYDVSGMLRSAEQESMVTEHGAKAIIGDLKNDLTDLISGFDAIMFVAGSRGKDVTGVDYQGLANVVDAAVSTNLKRFLYIGSINNGKTPQQFIPELENYYASIGEQVPTGLLENTKKPGYATYVEMKTKAEDHITNSGINYTILRAGLLTLEPGSGKVEVTEGTLNRFGITSRENVAKCFVAVLENSNTYRKIYTILDGDIPILEAFGEK